MMLFFTAIVAITWSFDAVLAAKINKKQIVSAFNPHRDASSETPMQIGNGNFAFSADVTGLQTFVPFNTLSSWGWHNSSLPTIPGQTSVEDFKGPEWWTHGRLVEYNQPNPTKPNISQWLIANPHRINLARIGFTFGGTAFTEDELVEKSQTLDLYSGVLSSNFTIANETAFVRTAVDPRTDTLAVEVLSAHIDTGNLGIFLDYPYASGKNKFDAPYVGLFNTTASHTTSLYARSDRRGATIKHDLDSTTYYTELSWEGRATVRHHTGSDHRYSLSVGSGDTLRLSVQFSSTRQREVVRPGDVFGASHKWWSEYWNQGAFISLPYETNTQARELQRRVILSQYLVTINGAGEDPPQESGLVNNGWYGKFHLEMIAWHSLHLGLWGKEDLLERHDDVYQRFLPSSLERAKKMGYEGARWGKMSDPSGRSAPGEINSLLIWQQPHPVYFAEAEYSRLPNAKTLKKWDEVITATADFMASYAYFNKSVDSLQLGPPMYPVSENTNPNDTINPTFELTYWRFGLETASLWKDRQGKPVPATWTSFVDNLPPLPVDNGTYVIYEGVEDMWNNPELTSDHPSMAMIYGFMKPPPDFNLTVMNNTMNRIYEKWPLDESYGWDFPMLAMTAARLGDYQRAVGFLLHESFQFDDVGMPIGGTRVPTPYFPGSAALLMAVAMMAGGWKEDAGGKFPREWDVKTEGFRPMFF